MQFGTYILFYGTYVQPCGAYVKSCGAYVIEAKINENNQSYESKLKIAQVGKNSETNYTEDA